MHVGRGLAAAHAAGLEHGDLKPENILIGLNGRARVADFGVARMLLEHDPLAGGGSVAGTPRYIAPEYLQGRGGDARSDQFSFCVTLWEILYRTLPFEGATRTEDLEAIASGEPAEREPKPGIPWRLRRALLRGMSLRPEDRWPDMDHLLAELLEIRQRPKVRKRRRQVAAVVLGVGLGSSVVTGLMLAPDAPRGSSSPDGINSEPATTLAVDADLPATEDDLLDEAGGGLVEEVAAAVDAGDLEGAYKLWAGAQTAAREGELADQSVEIAHIFLSEALASEDVDFRRAYDAAQHAIWAGGYALANLPPMSPVKAEIADLIRECTRLTSPEAQLLANFTDLHNAELARRCKCRGRPRETCFRALGSIGPQEHSCLASVMEGHETDARRYLGCLVPLLEKRQACVESVSAACTSPAIAQCQVTWEDGATACLQEAVAANNIFAACNIADTISEVEP